MMKKVLYSLLGLIVLLLLTIILIPVLFKDKINDEIKLAINDNVNADVNWESFDLSLISTFPNLKFELNDFAVKTQGVFAGDTLTSIKHLNFEMDLMSAISGSQIKIKSIDLIDPFFKIVVLPDSTANYDIAKSGEETETDVEGKTTDSEPFKLLLKSYKIQNARVIYDDATTFTYLDMNGLTHEGNGDFSLDNFLLNTNTTINSLTVIYEDIPYINKVKTELKADLEADMNTFKFTFKENHLALNNLGVGINGYFAMPGDDMDFDMSFKADNGTFGALLSLIPSIYASDMAGMDVKGDFTLDAYFKGPMTDNRFPSYGLDLKINDGFFQYTDLPKAISDIQVDFTMDNATGINDDLVMNLNRAYALLGDYVLDAKMVIKNPETDPFIDAKLMTQLDLSKLGDFMEVEDGEKYQGNITANVSAAGKLSDLENENYEAFKAEGVITILNMLYGSKDLDYEVEISSAYAYLKPELFQLTSFEGKIGKSDFSVDGQIDNLLAYMMSKDTLVGSFNFNSNLFDVNELAGEEEEVVTEESSTEEEEVAYEVIEVPGDVNFILKSNIQKMVYDEMVIEQFKGNLGVKDHRLYFDNTQMKMMGGTLALRGSYDTKNVKKPHIAFFMKVDEFDIQKSHEQIPMLGEMLPGSKNFSGKYSTDFSMVSDLLPNLDPDYNTLAGSGVLETKGVKVSNHPTFNKIAEKTKYDKLKSFDLKDLMIQFQFKDGKVLVSPFDMKMGPAKATISGENRFDQTIKYDMDLAVPRTAFGAAADAAVSQFASQISNLTGQNVPIGNTLKFKVVAEGPYDNPNVSVKPAGFEGEGSSVKEQVQELVEEKIEEVKEQVQEEVDKKKQEAIEKARKQADKIMADARKTADRAIELSKKTANDTRAEGNKKADEIESQAKTPIQKVAAKKAADKVREESEKKAKAIEDKGKKEAEGIMSEAQKKADQLIAEAEKQ